MTRGRGVGWAILIVATVVPTVTAAGVVPAASASPGTARTTTAEISISEKTGLANLTVYKGAKPSEYAKLMARPDRVQGDIHDGDFYGLMGVASPAQAAGASISMVSYDNGVSDDESANPYEHVHDCADQPPLHCLLPEYEPSWDNGERSSSGCTRNCRRYVDIAEAGGIVKYTIPGKLDLVTVDYPANTDPDQVATAVKAKYGIAAGANLVAELGSNGRTKALQLRAKNSNGSVRDEIIVPWSLTENHTKPVKIDSAYRFDGVVNYQAGKPGASPSWTQAAEIKRAADCATARNDPAKSAFCTLAGKQLDEAVAAAQTTTHTIIEHPKNFTLPTLAKGQVLSVDQLTKLATQVAQDVIAQDVTTRARSALGPAAVPPFVTKALTKAIPEIADYGHNAFLQISAVQGVTDKDSGALAKVCSALGPIPVVGSVAGIVNEAVGISSNDPPAAIAQKALEITKNVAGVALTVMAIAFPTLAPVAAVATVALEVAAALGKYLLGFLLPDPPDPREPAYQQNQAVLTQQGVQAQWEYDRYGTVPATSRGANLTQSLILQPTADNKTGSLALGGFTGVGYRQFYLRTEGVQVYRDGIRDVDLTCQFSEAGYGNDYCGSPIPLLASREHPLRVAFFYTSQSKCGGSTGTLCRDREASIQLIRPGMQALPVVYTVRG